MLDKYNKELNTLTESYLKINKLEKFHFDKFHISCVLPDLIELVEILRKCVFEKRLMTNKEREIFYPIDLDMDEVDI
jgi:hypothetical protein|tara:strand:- start:48 stop:278 length:231 start_codon:yes stop_codon:yes gene_type:complete